ncbi:ubiquinone anaerobic biosynthesis accessory factor UbiT [Microbulbifer rhizosphaerae]|uniref:Ubiquinone biosynthesis accessory factor UbiT n=1 Tax=Microbulbifer rhizosphaerae TaxID=1562603 RepID=A0A7W4WDR8_9GAMM|nr:SCP2 sterol-binding domain-containing protein [Microbulbifer rhizosphaerae]MBB3062372.1 putative lipid carrier protein YhbT [Microbulbifer rhizosphaerae]
MVSIRKSIARGGYRLGCRLLPVLPKWPGELALVKFLNVQLAEELEEGEFDFLEGRVLEIAVIDFRISLRMGKSGARFVRAPASAITDAAIAAKAVDFLAIASGREDPDTLFFHRRLSISGDTELGLTAKNRLDAIDRSRLPQRAQRWLVLIAGALADAAAK